MKILCFIDSLTAGGAQRQIVHLGRGFKERGNEVIFLTYHSINFFKSELDAKNIPVFTISEPNYLKRSLLVRKYIRENKPDAVLSFLRGANFMALFSGFPSKRWVLVVGERSANPKILKSKKQKYTRWLYKFADYVVANSHANMHMVKKVVPFLKDNKFQVIYNFVDVPQFSYNDKNPEKIIFTIAASYREIKNTEGLIRAVNQLSENHKNQIEIHWYGDSNNNYADQMKQLVRNFSLESRIFLHNKTEDIFSKYAESDFVCLFSHHEGFPNTICEAMSIGKPVIVSKVSDVPMFIKEDKNGFLCDSYSLESIKSALIKAVNSSKAERTRMGILNKALAEKKFDKEKIIDAYLNLFNEV